MIQGHCLRGTTEEEGSCLMLSISVCSIAFLPVAISRRCFVVAFCGCMHAHLPGCDIDFGEQYDKKQAPCRLLIMKKILMSIFTCSTLQNRIKDRSLLNSLAAFSYTPFTCTAKWQGARLWDLGAGKQKTHWGLLHGCRNAQQHLETSV